MNQPVEVLPPSDHRRGVQVQRHPWRVGPGRGLCPRGTLDEVDLLGGPQDPRRTAHPEQVTLCVTDRHSRVTVDRGAAEDVVQQREDPGQHVGGAIVRDVIPGQGDRSQMAVRVDPGGRGPDPRLGDLGAHVGRVARGGHAASVNHPAFNAALEDFPRSGGRSDGSRCSDVATNLGVALARYLGRWKNGVLR